MALTRATSALVSAAVVVLRTASSSAVGPAARPQIMATSSFLFGGTPRGGGGGGWTRGAPGISLGRWRARRFGGGAGVAGGGAAALAAAPPSPSRPPSHGRRRRDDATPGCAALHRGGGSRSRFEHPWSRSFRTGVVHAGSIGGIDDDAAGADGASTDPGEGVGSGSTTESLRVRLLHERLSALDACDGDPEELAGAAERSVLDPAGGYDARFGRSAIRAYRTYVRGPRKGMGKGKGKGGDTHGEDPRVAALRTARQIDFLIKRHRSREAEWVRNTDDPADLMPGGRDAGEGRRYPRRTFPLVLVLDNLRSAFNVGSIFRTADAAGCAAVITTGITPHPNGSGAEKLAKSALGAERLVPTRHFETTMDAVRFLRREGGGGGGGGGDDGGVLLVAMETTDRSRCYTDVEFPRPTRPAAYAPVARDDDGGDDDGFRHRDFEGGGVALFLGNEVTGVDVGIVRHLDEMVEIPMFGGKNSLNVAAAAPVVIYEVLRQWGALDAEDEKGGDGGAGGDGED